jgi:hypothetical protein
MMRLKAISRIIKADCSKNYPNRPADPESVILDFEKYAKNGGAYFSTENVIIVLKYLGDDCVEFLCMNGGSGKAINTMLLKLAASGSYSRAVTYYDNPRINDLAKYSKFPAEVKKVDLGEDRTYEMSIDLRSV